MDKHIPVFVPPTSEHRCSGYPAARIGDWHRTRFECRHDDVAYILDTFPDVSRNDRKAQVSYRTKERILALYDILAPSSATSAQGATR